MGSRRPRADSDRLLSAALAATARRLAFAEATPADAASELRALAAGRVDLLAVAAGAQVGSWLANPLPHGEPLIAAGFLIRAGGADIADGGMTLAVDAVEKTRQNSRAGNQRWSDTIG